MRTRSVALCGVAAMVGGLLGAVPSAAGAPQADRAPAARTTALDWKDCSTERYPSLQCSSLEVPLDHERPDGEQITLALSRVPHTSDEASYQGPLLVNPGGPGGSGLNLAGYVAGALPEDVASTYDVIGFDPRGVGKSEPALDCKPGHFDPPRPDSVPSTRGIEKANLKRAKDFAKACRKKYGKLLQYIDTVSSVRDMDRIRAALGAEKINYFGYSYGTYLGAVYAKLYPQRVRRAVLDSVVDPTGTWYRDNLDQDYAFDGRHKAFMAWIAEHDASYRLGTDPAEIEAEWYAMRAALAKNPADGRVGGSELEDTFLPGGYYNGYWPYLAEAFAAYVNENDTAPLVEAYENFAAVDSGGDNGFSVYAAVECRDASWPKHWKQWRQDMWEAHDKAPFMTWNNAWYNAQCAFWPTKSLEPVDVTNDELPPVLLFQATDDAATPYGGAVVVHEKLAGSSLVVEQGGGNHGITLSGNACLDGYLADYLASGTVPRGGGGVDATCSALPEPEPFPATESASASASSSGSGATLHGLIGYRS
ncbi:alpha/beta hydrolase [Streptomyces sp. KLOTTS4A1]|uniref:alpha/beta hydrolase n=1 Tax=Streptomyces sp. KLOTTS4A1 TaxID=3390996 RepID=UPI0039F49BB2